MARGVAAVGLLILVAVTCHGQRPEPPEGAPARTIGAPAAWYADAAWLPDGRIVVTVGPGEQVAPRRPLRLLSRTGEDLGQLVPERATARCGRLVDDGPQVLPDGRLGFRETCGPADPARGLRVRLLAWDLEGRPDVLLETDEPVGEFTFAPGLEDGLYSVDSSICAGIAAIRDGEPAPLPVRLDGVNWALDAALSGGECVEEGRAGGPAISPDGREVAFAASPASAGVEGQARLDVPWNLYVMDRREQRPKAVLEDVGSLGRPLWSPDGRLIAFNGEIDGRAGVYVLRLADRRVLPVSLEADDAATSWSPAGRELLAVRESGPLDELPERSELIRLDVSGVVGG